MSRVSGRSTRHTAAGFSLVEAAVVLVVIGVILGAVLQGRSLIVNAEYKSFRQELHDYRTSFLAFRDRYDALPGDFAAATDRIDATLTNGNGNGLVEDGPLCDADTDEACIAWQHLRAARIVKGNPALSGAAAPPEHGYGGVVSSFFTGTGANATFGHHMLVTDVPVEIAERLDADEDDDRCQLGRITGQDCASATEWPDDADTVDIVYAL